MADTEGELRRGTLASAGPAAAAETPATSSSDLTAPRPLRSWRRRRARVDEAPTTAAAPTATAPPAPAAAGARHPVSPVPPVLATGLLVPSVWAVAIAVLLGAGAGLAAANSQRRKPPVYQSAAVVLLDDPAAIATGTGVVNDLYAIRTKYIGLIQTDPIAKPVAAALGLPSGAVAASLHALLDPSSLNTVVLGAARDPSLSERLANAAANQMVAYVAAEQAALPVNINPQYRIRMTVVRAAGPGVRVSPSRHKEITSALEYGGIALAVSYVIVQVAVDGLRRRRAIRSQPVAVA